MPTLEPSMADDVAAYLATNGIGRVGRDIFVNNMPKYRNNIFLISDTPGLAPEQYYPVDHPGVQVAFYAQASHHAEGQQKIVDAYRLLNRKQNFLIGTRYAYFARATASPSCIGLESDSIQNQANNQNRWLFVVNIMFKIRGVDGQ